MRAVLLAGGKGTRLRPYTTVLPKPLMPVGDKSILEILIAQLQDSGFHKVTISLGHLAHLVRAVIGNGDKWDVAIDYSIEDVPLGTSGPLALVPELDETFLVLNGDILCNIDFRELLAFHREQGACLTIAAHARRVDIDYGVLYKSGHVLKNYDEKPSIDYEVSMGIYVFEPEVLQYIQPNTRMDFPDLIQILMNEGKDIAVFGFDGIWYDLGREEDFKSVQKQLPDLKKSISSL